MQKITTITTKELRDNLSEVLERVAIGREEIAVSKWGRIKVHIVPAKQKLLENHKKLSISTHSAFGMWRKRKDMKNSVKWVSENRRKQSFRIHK